MDVVQLDTTQFVIKFSDKSENKYQCKDANLQSTFCNCPACRVHRCSKGHFFAVEILAKLQFLLQYKNRKSKSVKGTQLSNLRGDLRT